MPVGLAVCLAILTQFALTLNIPLSRSRQTCLIITQGSYQFEYVVSGINQKQVRCIIKENNKTVLESMGRSQFETEFIIKEKEATICFSSLDTQAKAVSFDFIKLDDPLRGLIQNKQKMKIHQTLYSSFQQLQKLYRDQHFFIERNYIHQILLRNTEVALVFFLMLKLVVVFLASFSQLFYVRRLFETNYRPVSETEESI